MTHPARGRKPRQRTRSPLPRIKFTIRLAPDADLESLRACIERTLAIEHEKTFPDLVKLTDSIWDHDPRMPRARVRDYFVKEKVEADRRSRLKAGKPAGLPLKLTAAFEDACKRPPRHAPNMLEEQFVVLTLPIFWRHFRRTACKPSGSLFDVAYALQRACGGRIKVTPCLSLPAGGVHSAFIANVFPERCRVPVEAEVPNRANWHLFNIRAIDGGGASLIPPGVNGAGVVIGHLDTGWTAHPQLNFPTVGSAIPASPNFPPGFEANTLETGVASAREAVGLVSIPGTQPHHGTRTASLIVSNSDLSVSGVAPGATIFSVRCTPDVVILSPFLDDEQIATAIVTAVSAGARVISMSLGGTPSAILHYAVRLAVASDVIVVAAAGNYSAQVVFPAAFPECIAVGGSTADDCHWTYSSRNQLGLTPIDIAAPSEFVRNAFWSGTNARSGSGSGTSFATAQVAGAAALWMQFFGRTALINALGGRAPLQALFMRHLADTAREPDFWNVPLDGPGILDLSGLLSRATRPNPATFPLPAWVDPLAAAGAAGTTIIGDILTSAPASWVSGVLGGAASDLQNFGEETWNMILSNPIVNSALQGLEVAGQVAEDAAKAADDAAEEIAETAQEAAEEAAETVTEAAESAVETVADTASDTLSTAAGWLGF